MKNNWQNRGVSPDEVVSLIKSHDQIWLHGDCAASLPLEAALAKRAPSLTGVIARQVHKDGPEVLADPSLDGHIRIVSLFGGAGIREAVAQGRADYVPVHLSDIPLLIRAGRFKVDVAVVQLSWPDDKGFCTLGTSVDSARQAVDSAKIVVAELNKQMPYTQGQGKVHMTKLKAFTVTDRPLVERTAPPATPEMGRIASLIASLVPHEATLQIGIGSMPNAVLSALGKHRDLGLHTEMFSDAAVELVKAGVITNRCKAVNKGKAVVAFVAGTRVTYDFVHENRDVLFYPTDFTNAQSNIVRQHRMTSINAGLEIDLTGQVCADSIGERIHSGVGGQLDFVRAASLAPDGKAILAIPATALGGTSSRIVPVLKAGAGVVTPRADVAYVVTEYGIVDLRGLTLRARAEALIAIAHPDHRADLKAAASARKLF